MAPPCCDPSSDKFALYNFPICGGFCAPTKNPDPSCWRHVSNEFTVPASGPYMKIGPYIEFSWCCMKFGSLGLEGARKHRKRLMAAGAILNSFAMILSVIAAIGGLSGGASTIRALPWVQGKISEGAGRNIEVYMNMVARVSRLDCKNDVLCSSTAASSGFTHKGSGVYETYYTNEVCGNTRGFHEVCKKCRSKSLSSFTLIMAIITNLPSITTNLQRATLFGDVNCQATMGVVSNALGFFSTIASLLAYRSACMMDLPTKISSTTLKWDMGIGFRCLIVATILKLFDMTLHLLLPTPAPRALKPPKDVTELVDFMMLGT